jgi:hypothetical protein
MAPGEPARTTGLWARQGEIVGVARQDEPDDWRVDSSDWAGSVTAATANTSLPIEDFLLQSGVTPRVKPKAATRLLGFD